MKKSGTKKSSPALPELLEAVMAEVSSIYGVREKTTPNFTSYHLKEGGLCGVRIARGKVVVSFFKGIWLEDPFGKLTGDGKYVRSLEMETGEADEWKALESYLEQSVAKTLELEEMKRMKKKK